MITIEPIVSIVRIGEFNADPGDAYTSVCTMIKTGPKSVRLVGMAGGPLVEEEGVKKIGEVITPRQAIMLRDKIFALGFNEVSWERVREGKMEEVRFKRKS